MGNLSETTRRIIKENIENYYEQDAAFIYWGKRFTGKIANGVRLSPWTKLDRHKGEEWNWDRECQKDLGVEFWKTAIENHSAIRVIRVYDLSLFEEIINARANAIYANPNSSLVAITLREERDYS